MIPAYQAERMEVFGQGGMRVIEKPWIAISQEALSQKGEYQMLLNENIGCEEKQPLWSEP